MSYPNLPFWQTNTFYSGGQLVESFGGKLFKTNFDLTSTIPPVIDVDSFSTIYSWVYETKLNVAGQWDIGIEVNVGQVVEYNGNFYIVKNFIASTTYTPDIDTTNYFLVTLPATLSPPFFPIFWQTGLTLARGDIVEFRPFHYLVKNDIASSLETPDVDLVNYTILETVNTFDPPIDKAITSANVGSGSATFKFLYSGETQGNHYFAVVRMS